MKLHHKNGRVSKWAMWLMASKNVGSHKIFAGQCKFSILWQKFHTWLGSVWLQCYKSNFGFWCYKVVSAMILYDGQSCVAHSSKVCRFACAHVSAFGCALLTQYFFNAFPCGNIIYVPTYCRVGITVAGIKTLQSTVVQLTRTKVQKCTTARVIIWQQVFPMYMYVIAPNTGLYCKTRIHERILVTC